MSKVLYKIEFKADDAIQAAKEKYEEGMSESFYGSTLMFAHWIARYMILHAALNSVSMDECESKLNYLRRYVNELLEHPNRMEEQE